jgi:hypothetical protein
VRPSLFSPKNLKDLTFRFLTKTGVLRFSKLEQGRKKMAAVVGVPKENGPPPAGPSTAAESAMDTALAKLHDADPEVREACTSARLSKVSVFSVLFGIRMVAEGGATWNAVSVLRAKP